MIDNMKTQDYLDEYYSKSLVIKGENKNKFSKNISFGYGSEYKYDWGFI